MKFRKLLLGFRLWARACRARRSFKRTKRQFELYKIEKDREKDRLIKHYERQLSLERTRNESLHLAWADRWLQRDKLTSLGITSSLIEEKAQAKLAPPDESRPEEGLNSDQFFELMTRKDQFFENGRELGKSSAEIENRWNDIKESVVSDVRLAIM